MLKRICFSLFLIITISTPLWAANELPNLGGPSSNVLTTQQRIELGQEFMLYVRRHMNIIQNPLVENYIQNLGDRLVSHAGASQRKFNFFVIENPVINAFAGPDGNIGVFSGLILQTTSECELAAVMAHETAHVTQHHIERGIASSKRAMIPLLASIVAAAALGATHNGDAAAGVLMAGTAGVAQNQINFTRSNEAEADHLGMKILYDAKFSPQCMPMFFERLRKEGQFNGHPPAFLSTHPTNEQRIQDSLNRADLYPKRKVTSSEDYYFIKAQLKLMQFRNMAQALRYFKEHEKKHPNIATKYGYGLALAQAYKFKDAIKIFKALHKEDLDSYYIDLALAKAETAGGDKKQGFELFENTYQIYPDLFPVVVEYANALIADGKPRDAIGILNEYNWATPNNTTVLQTLLKAQAASGQQVLVHMTKAKIYLLNGMRKDAVYQLQLAMQVGNATSDQKEQIRAQLKTLRAQKKDS